MKELEDAMTARSNQGPLSSLWRTWLLFHEKWHGVGVPALPLTVEKVLAVCALLRAGGYRTAGNYLSCAKDHHVAGGDEWSDQLARAVLDKRRTAHA